MSANLYLTFASLIVGAVMAMVQGGAAAIPPPLSRMRHALAGVRSYRIVQTSAQVVGFAEGRRSRHMNGMAQQQTIVVVRHGSTLQTDALITTTIQGRPQVFEVVNAGGKSCVRQGQLGSWHCLATPHTAGPTLTDLARLRWSPVPDRVIRGQRCRGYWTTWRPAADTPRTRATLWVSVSSGLPVELVSVASDFNQPPIEPTPIPAAPSMTFTAVTTDTVVWGAWNDPSLSVPPI